LRSFHRLPPAGGGSKKVGIGAIHEGSGEGEAEHGQPSQGNGTTAAKPSDIPSGFEKIHGSLIKGQRGRVDRKGAGFGRAAVFGCEYEMCGSAPIGTLDILQATMKTILIIDDMAFCRELFSLALRREGYEVLTAGSGREGMQLMQSHKPDLVMLDVMMPDLDGIATLRMIRATPDIKHIPVFVLTADEDRERIRQARQIGVQAYILKSQFLLETTLDRIREIVGEIETAPLETVTGRAVEEVWGDVQ